MLAASLIDAKEQIRRAVDIVDLVGDYIQLRREGRGYKGLCPWHDDARPSLQVNPDRQSFKCWVCNIGGDIFSFVMKAEGVEFPEALSLLAERAGVELPERRGGAVGGTDERRLWYQALAWVEAEYQACLLESPEAAPARTYLEQRGLDRELWQRFHLGYAPAAWNWLVPRAKGTEFSAALLEKLGLLGRSSQTNQTYDRFRGRVLFSIRDPQGRPVATGGRLLPGQEEASPAKYINSPETPLFSKSRLLYGLDLARDAMARTRTALVMEGYTDVMTAHQFGFTHAVAVLGTALGEHHIRLLKRFADRIVLVLDGDEAGQRRTNEVLELFLAQEVDLRILTLPDGQDPCEYLLAQGAEAFAEQVSGAVDALEHRMRVAVATLGPTPTTHDVHTALESILATLAKLPRRSGETSSAAHLKEDQILNRLARRFEIAEQALRGRLSTLRRGDERTRRQSNEPTPQAEGPGTLDPAESLLLEILLAYPEALDAMRAANCWARVQHTACRTVLERCGELADTGIVPSFGRLLLEFDDPGIKHLLVDCDERARAKAAAGNVEWSAVWESLLGQMARREAEAAGRAQMAALHAGRGTTTEDDEQALLQTLIDTERTRRGISLPTEG